MQHSGDEKQFEQAVKHLFRNLDKQSALKHNPLVAHFFGSGRYNRPGRSILANIRNLIVAIADECFAEDVNKGLDFRAERQRAILKTVLDNVPVESARSSLGLSIRQYYRDRGAICSRIARMILRRRAIEINENEPVEPLDLALSRASKMVDLGYCEQASQEYESIILGTDSDIAKIAALLGIGRAALRSGDVEASVGALTAAKSILDRCELKPQSEELREELLLLSILLERAAGRDDRAMAISASLSYACEQCSTGEKKARLPLLKVELENYQMCLERYDIAQARRHFKRATVMIDRLADPTVERARLALMACFDYEGVTMDMRILNTEKAFAACVAAGYAYGAISALHHLATSHAMNGDDDLVLEYSGKALHAAELVDGSVARLEAVTNTAGALMKTRFWRMASPMLFKAESFARRKTLPWLSLKRFQGEIQRNEGRPLEAIATLTEALGAVGVYQNTVLHAALLKELALSYYYAGMDPKATECVDSAVALSDGLSFTPPTFSYMLYDIAATLIPHSDFRERAARLRSELTKSVAAASDRKLKRWRRTHVVRG